jgi:hypothetical protein
VKIDSVLRELAEISIALNDDFYIIGSAALYLAGAKIVQANDVDILTSSRDAEIFKTKWKSKLINFQPEKEILFRSNFAQFEIDGILVEVMGNLEIKKNDIWQKLKIETYELMEFENNFFKIPTLNEQKRILALFGRKKDIAKLDYL